MCLCPSLPLSVNLCKGQESYLLEHHRFTKTHGGRGSHVHVSICLGATHLLDGRLVMRQQGHVSLTICQQLLLLM